MLWPTLMENWAIRINTHTQTALSKQPFLYTVTVHRDINLESPEQIHFLVLQRKYFLNPDIFVFISENWPKNLHTLKC